MRPFFPPGSEQMIYQQPITGEKSEGKATLVRCLRRYTEFDYPGVIAEEWDVRFQGEQEEYRRIVTAPIPEPQP